MTPHAYRKTLTNSMKGMKVLLRDVKKKIKYSTTKNEKPILLDAMLLNGAITEIDRLIKIMDSPQITGKVISETDALIIARRLSVELEQPIYLYWNLSGYFKMDVIQRTYDGEKFNCSFVNGKRIEG